MIEAIEHYIEAGKLWLHLFLAMPDHLHALASFPRDERTDDVIRNWKRYIAKKTKIKRQDGFFDHRLRNTESFDEKAHYIRMNPVRAGLIDDAEAWTFVWPPSQPQTAR